MSKEAACLAIVIACAMEKEKSPKRKRKRRIWTKDWLQKRSEFSHENLISEFQLSSSVDYRNYLRMDCMTFGELLEMVTPIIQKEDTVMREAISAKQRLYVTL